MRRGEVWTVQDAAYASKARPAVVIQADDLLSAFESVILLPLTTFDNPDANARVMLAPSGVNGLNETSYVMTEKPFTVRKKWLGARIGVLTTDQMSEISRELAHVLAISSDALI